MKKSLCQVSINSVLKIGFVLGIKIYIGGLLMESDTNVGALRTFGWISFFVGFVLTITLIIALNPHGWLLGIASIVGGIFYNGFRYIDREH